MGVCSVICSDIEGRRKEIKIEDIQKGKEIKIEDLIKDGKYPKIVYLQMRIKRYLRKKRYNENLAMQQYINSTNPTKPNSLYVSPLDNSISYEDNSNNAKYIKNEKPKNIKKEKEKNFKSNDSTMANISMISNNGNCDRSNDLISYQKIRDSSNYANLISKDPFKNSNKRNKDNPDKKQKNISKDKNKKNNNNLNKDNLNNKDNIINSNEIIITSDPRDQEHNDVRKIYPKIEEDGYTYVGEWKNGKRDGIGILSMKEVSKFIGEFQDNSVFGFGVLLHNEGEKFVGYWNDFKANGLGFFISPTHSFIKGNWDNDKLNGYGLENWVKGQYEGEYLEGNKQGIGELTFEEGESYSGDFEENIISGIGTFIFNDGRKYEGQWKNSKMNGFGCIYSAKSKTWFEGEFVDNKRDGFGVFFTDKKIYIGMWKCSKLDGEIVIYENSTNVMKKTVYENGKIVRSLPNEHKIFFEKLIPDIISIYKNKNANNS